MKIEKTTLDGVLVIEPDFRFSDHRGEIICAFEDKALEDTKLSQGLREFLPHRMMKILLADNQSIFIKHNFSISYKNVLRGIHVSDCFKLCYCPFGNIRLVAIDCRMTALTFGKWEAFEISSNNFEMILVPPSFGLAHLVRSQVAIFYYHWSDSFDDKKQLSYRWNSFGIEWPITNPILSERDKHSTYLSFKKETTGFSNMPAEQLRRMDEEDRR